jgi:hypothetical protein
MSKFSFNDDPGIEQIGYQRPDGRIYCLSCWDEVPDIAAYTKALRIEANPIPEDTDIPDDLLECANCGIWLLSEENR